MARPRRNTSFDDMTEYDTRTDTVAETGDEDLRDMVAMMPDRNEDRMFSDAPAASRDRVAAPGPAPQKSAGLRQNHSDNYSDDISGEDAGEYSDGDQYTEVGSTEGGTRADTGGSYDYYYTYSDGGLESRANDHPSMTTASRDISPTRSDSPPPPPPPLNGMSRPHGNERVPRAADPVLPKRHPAEERQEPVEQPRPAAAPLHKPAPFPKPPRTATLALPTMSFAGWPAASFSSAGDSFRRQNIADACAAAGERFFNEDLATIFDIIRRRFSTLLPHARRFVAHVVAFWGGITYLRRATTAFIRILNKDSRVRELLERTAWASASTLKVFLAICRLVLQSTVRFYTLMRDTVIPELRLVLPRQYAIVTANLLRAAERSPWICALGPVSFQLDMHRDKLPDPLWLHRKFGVDPVKPKSKGWTDRSVPEQPRPSREYEPSDTDQTTGDGGASRPESMASSGYTYTYGSGTSRRDGDEETTARGEDETNASDSYYYTYGTRTTMQQPLSENNAAAQRARLEASMDTIATHDGPQQYREQSPALKNNVAPRRRSFGKENNGTRPTPVGRRLDYQGAGGNFDIFE